MACVYVPYEPLCVEEQQVHDGESDGGAMGHGDTQHHRRPLQSHQTAGLQHLQLHNSTSRE